VEGPSQGMPVGRRACCKMRRRHAAALALIGWYLMIPPVSGDRTNSFKLLRKAPLSEWTILNVFDSADSCSRHREQVRALGLKTANKLSESLRAVYDADVLSECIATDDPRLKGN